MPGRAAGSPRLPEALRPAAHHRLPTKSASDADLEALLKEIEEIASTPECSKDSATDVDLDTLLKEIDAICESAAKA